MLSGVRWRGKGQTPVSKQFFLLACICSMKWTYKQMIMTFNECLGLERIGDMFRLLWLESVITEASLMTRSIKLHSILMNWMCFPLQVWGGFPPPAKNRGVWGQRPPAKTEKFWRVWLLMNTTTRRHRPSQCWLHSWHWSDQWPCKQTKQCRFISTFHFRFCFWFRCVFRYSFSFFFASFHFVFVFVSFRFVGCRCERDSVDLSRSMFSPSKFKFK